jgi:hypothetical protein
MQPLTYKDVKDELRRIAGQTGVQVDDPRMLTFLNLAQERLCVLGEWPFQYARLKFCQHGGLVSLPSEYEAIVHSSVDDNPAPIQNSWYEFLGEGPGQQDTAGWVNVGIDRGESPVFRQPGLPGKRLKVTALADERVGSGDELIRPTILVMGYDDTGAWVRSYRDGALRDGVAVELAGDTSSGETETEEKFSRITQVVKPATRDDVLLGYVDDAGVEYEAARYAARDLNPSFRQYHFPSIRPGDTALVRAIVRRRLPAVTEDTDPLFVPSLSALRLGVMGVALEDKGDLVQSQAAFALAKDFLTQLVSKYKATLPSPPVEVSPTMAFGDASTIF